MGLDLIVRAHEVKQYGHEFTANNQLCTIFSAPFYSNNNYASVMEVSEDLKISFITLKPEPTFDMDAKKNSLKKFMKKSDKETEPDAKTPKPG